MQAPVRRTRHRIASAWRFWPVVGLLAVLGAAFALPLGAERRVDGASAATFDGSVAAMRARLAPEERRRFDAALSDVRAAAVRRTSGATAGAALRIWLDGMSTDEIVDLADQVRPRLGDDPAEPAVAPGNDGDPARE